MARWSSVAAGAILVTFAGAACAKRTTVRDDPDTTTDAAVDAGKVGAKGTAGTVGEVPGDPRYAIAKLRRLDRMAIEIALMVDRRVTAPPVDALAARMVEDHAAIQRRIQAFEEGSDVPIRMHPNGIVRGPAEYETIENLRRLEGDRFERAYLQWVFDSHRDVLAEIDGIAERTGREDLRRLLEQVQPVLQEHMDMAADAMTATEREQVRGEEEIGNPEVRGAD